MKIISPQPSDSIADVTEYINDPERDAVIFLFGKEDGHLIEQLNIFARAMKIHEEREKERQGVWRRSGIKGQVTHVFAKAERAFREVFQNNKIPNEDHLYDVINYAAFALRLGYQTFSTMNDELALKGEWPW